AYEAVKETLDRPDDPSAALVAINSDGHVKAMYGGNNFREQKVNYAVGTDGGGTGRQPGSAFKPFVLAQAVHEGYTVQSAFKAPGRITIPKANAGADWKVSNYGGGDKGVQDLIQATKDSTNTVYAQLMVEIGAEKVAALAKRMGIRSELPAVNSLALGTGEVSVIDLTSAYSVFANRGELVEPVIITRIETADGRVLEQLSPRRERVLSQETADIVTHCLRQVVERGTGTAARFGKPAAGKTGTTQHNGDAWFAGYTPRLTAVVWMGYPEGQQREMDSVHGRSVTGGSFPAEIWKKFMTDATEGIDTGTFVPVRSFPGRRLNPTVRVEEPTTTTSSTTTSVPEESTTSSTEPKESTTTSTAPGATSSTTAPPTTSTTGPTTTTTAPPTSP
ncbi:MAG: transglycosylase domain-containing protein, partial [Actinomycetota bacterium]